MLKSPERPPGIDCADWQPTDPPKGKLCKSYPGGGGCTLHADGECSEWQKANPGRAVAWVKPTADRVTLPLVSVSAPSPSTADPHAPAPLSLVPSPPRESAAARARRAFEAQLSPAERPAKAVLDPPPFEPAKAIADADIESLEKLADEITIRTPELGDVHLVKQHTDPSLMPEGRIELTFREAATLRLIVDSFPGARVVAIKASEETPF